MLRREEHDSLENRKIAVGHCDHRGLTEARQVVDAFDEDRASEREPNVHAEHCHDRQEGVA